MSKSEELLMIGIDFNSAASEYRRVFHLSLKQLTALYQKDLFPAETIILSTCNRTEFYFYGNHPADFYWKLIEVLNNDQSVQREMFYQYQAEAVILHLLELAVGLKSMIIGETEILGQIATAGELPAKLGKKSPVLSRLFIKSLLFARRIRVQSGIGGHSTALTTLLVKELKHYYGKLVNRPVLVLGNGEIAQKAAQVLLYNGLRVTVLTRKNLWKPSAIIGDITVVYGYENLPQFITANDILIAATSAPHLLIREEQRPILSGKLMIDLSFPPNIDPALSQSGNPIWDLDYFGALSRRNLELEQLAVVKADCLCKQALAKFISPDIHFRKFTREGMNLPNECIAGRS
jgi:glutamyl-tRNA reductase